MNDRSSSPVLGKPLRLALVGAGNIARQHLRSLKERPDQAVLAAVCDNSLDAARALAAEGACDVVYGSHSELCAAGGIDAAVIASPHNLHFEMAAAFVEAGIPVLVEKPLVTGLDELRKLRDLAARHNVLVVAGQMRRFEREAMWSRRWMEQDPERFGRLRSFDIQSWQNINAYINRVGRQHWLLDGVRAGGGVVISLAVHQLDLIRYLGDCDFEEVSAFGSFEAPFYNGAESNASVLFRMSNGAVGTLHATYGAARVPFCEAMTLFGEHGTVTQQVEKLGDYRGPFYVSTETGDTTEVFPDQFKGFSRAAEAELNELHESSFVNQLVHFARAVRGEVPARNDIAQNFNTIACIDAIAESLKTGKAVKVATA
jgi:predicted dehydrogenase